MYSEIDSSLKLCDKMLDKMEAQDGDYAKILARKSIILDIKGETEEAVSGLLEAISIQKSESDSVELSYCYNNLGISYFYTYRYPEAMKYYKLSAEIDSLRKDIPGWAGTQVNIAIIQSNSNQYEQAQYTYNLILGQMESIQDSSLNGTIYSNKAKLSVVTEQFEKALKEVEAARTYVMSENNPSSKMTLEVLTSNIYMRLKKFDNALEAAKSGLSYDADSAYIERRVHLYECISHAFYAKAMIDSGDFYNNLYQTTRDELFNSETQALVEEVQVKYDVSAYELEQERLKLKSIEEQNETAESKAQRNLFIAIAALFVILVIILLYRSKLKKAEKMVLEDQLRFKEELVKQKEAFMGEIHHRVKNNLQLVASMLAIQSMRSDNDEIKKTFNASKNRIEAMSLIHEKLYQTSDFERVNLVEYVRNLTNQILDAYQQKSEIALKLTIEKIDLHIDSVVPLGLVLNELMTNSIKYAFEDKSKPEISIKMYELEGLLHLDYRDNGKGLSADKENGFGSYLLTSLNRQMKAAATEKSNNGYQYLLKIENYKSI